MACSWNTDCHPGERISQALFHFHHKQLLYLHKLSNFVWFPLGRHGLKIRKFLKKMGLVGGEERPWKSSLGDTLMQGSLLSDGTIQNGLWSTEVWISEDNQVHVLVVPRHSTSNVVWMFLPLSSCWQFTAYRRNLCSLVDICLLSFLKELLTHLLCLIIHCLFFVWKNVSGNLGVTAAKYRSLHASCPKWMVYHHNILNLL